MEQVDNTPKPQTTRFELAPSEETLKAYSDSLATALSVKPNHNWEQQKHIQG